MNKKLKVCILSNGLERGGTDTFVINLCKAIDKDKFDVIVVNPCQDSKSNVREPNLLKTSVRLFHTSDLGLGIWTRLRHFKTLYDILKEKHFDVFSYMRIEK